MAETRIAWADFSWNPWIGCTKVSEGCANCYMFRDQRRFNMNPDEIRRTSNQTFNQPWSRRRDGCFRWPAGSFVFVCSWSDFFHPDADWEWRSRATEIMAQRKDLRFLILTKRPDSIHEWAQSWVALEDDYGEPSHIWLGVTAENQARADERIPQLLDINWPGKKFVSVEPQLEAVDLRRWLKVYGHIGGPCCKDGEGFHALGSGGPLKGPSPELDWVICGGESGPDARPFNDDWARQLRDQCQAANVPFLFKQRSGDKNPDDLPKLDGRRWRERPKP